MEELGLNKSNDGFLIKNILSDDPEYTWMQRKPKGCFKEECNDGSAPKKCVYMNAYFGPDSNNVKGMPICSIAKHLNGTINTIGGANGGCPIDYSVVMDE